MNKKTMETNDNSTGVVPMMACQVCGRHVRLTTSNVKVETDDNGKKVDHYGECPNGCTI